MYFVQQFSLLIILLRLEELGVIDFMKTEHVEKSIELLQIRFIYQLHSVALTHIIQRAKIYSIQTSPSRYIEQSLNAK